MRLVRGCVFVWAVMLVLAILEVVQEPYEIHQLLKQNSLLPTANMRNENNGTLKWLPYRICPAAWIHGIHIDKM